MTTATHTLRGDAQVIGLVGLAHGISHFFHLIIAPLFPWLKSEFGFSYAELGLLMTVFFVVSGIGQALAGFVVDRLGALPVLFSGIALLAISALGLAFSHNYAMLMAFSAVAGLGNCVFHPADFTLLNRRVSSARLGHAFSVHGISGSLGWATAPVFLAGLAAVIGWRGALLGAAALAVVVLTVLIAFRHTLNPREVAASLAASAATTKARTQAVAFMALPAVWLCFAFFFISSMSLGGVQSFAPAALQELYGIPFALAAACSTAYMLAAAGGMVVGGFVAVRVEHHDRVLALAFAAAGALCVLVASGSVPSASVVLWLGMIGFCSGIAGPSRDLLVRAAAPRNATGRVYGVVYSGLDIGLSISPPIFGALMDSHHPGWVFILIGLFQTLAVVPALSVAGNTARRRSAQAA